jgi:hypothetical protein
VSETVTNPTVTRSRKANVSPFACHPQTISCSNGLFPTANWRDLGGGQLKTWLLDPGLATATTLYLKEGIVQQTKPFTPVNAGNLTTQTWTGITMVGELDELELRDGDGKTVAKGEKQANLIEP